MQTNHILLRWAIGAILAGLLVGLAIFWATNLRAQTGLSSSQSGNGIDPLTAAEQELALDGAATTGALTVAAELSTAPDKGAVEAEDVAGQMPTQEVLLIERNADKKVSQQQARQGMVYVYDYTTDELIHSVVNVETGELIEQARVQGVQLPLTAAEEARAIALAWQDAETHQMLADQFALVTGQPLETLTQLKIKASVFLADSLPGRLNKAAQACGIQRCAQLLLVSAEDVSFEMLPIVSLSQGDVLQVELLD